MCVRAILYGPVNSSFFFFFFTVFLLADFSKTLRFPIFIVVSAGSRTPSNFSNMAQKGTLLTRNKETKLGAAANSLTFWQTRAGKTTEVATRVACTTVMSEHQENAEHRNCKPLVRIVKQTAGGSLKFALKRRFGKMVLVIVMYYTIL